MPCNICAVVQPGGLAVAQDNGVPPLPRRVPGQRRPGGGPLARPALSESDLDRIRAALDKAENESAQADAAVLSAPPASGPRAAADEIGASADTAAQPVAATAAQPAAAEPETAGAVPADAKLVLAQRPPAEQRPDHQ